MERLRSLLPYTSLLVLIAACYTGWTMWSRYNGQRQAEQQAAEQEHERDVEVARRIGDIVKVQGFYATPGVVNPGGRALVCYGVTNATVVSIEPYIEDTKPSLSRCLEVHPTVDTEYKLTAADSAGHKATSSFVLRVAK